MVSKMLMRGDLNEIEICHGRPWAVNAFLAQPFVNYNMAHGWYLTSSPVITANWRAAHGEKWTVPIGGGFGRLFKVGDQSIDASIQGFYHVIHPEGGPTWSLRAQVDLLFPNR